MAGFISCASALSTELGLTDKMKQKCGLRLRFGNELGFACSDSLSRKIPADTNKCGETEHIQ